MKQLVITVDAPETVTKDYTNLDELINDLIGNEALQERFNKYEDKERGYTFKSAIEDFLFNDLLGKGNEKGNFYTAKFRLHQIDLDAAE